MTEKFTKKQMFGYISDFLMATTPNMDATPEGMSPDEFLELAIGFCAHEVALLEKKHATKGGKTSGQLANDATKVEILAVLDEPMRSTDIAAKVGISVQKCTALVSQMVKDGSVLRHEDKKVVTFTRAE